MKYTIYTDGAYTQIKNLCGCSYLILTDTHYIHSDSVTLLDVSKPTNAETVSVGLAAEYLLDNVHLEKDDVVTFNIDCLSTISFCKKYVNEKGIVMSNSSKVITAIGTLRALSRKCKVRFEKVHGHKKVINPNTYVDRLAKIAIRRD